MTCPDEEVTQDAAARGRYAAGAALVVVLLLAEVAGDVLLLWLGHPDPLDTACETLKAQPLALQTTYGRYGEALPHWTR